MLGLCWRLCCKFTLFFLLLFFFLSCILVVVLCGLWTCGCNSVINQQMYLNVTYFLMVRGFQQQLGDVFQINYQKTDHGFAMQLSF